MNICVVEIKTLILPFVLTISSAEYREDSLNVGGRVWKPGRSLMLRSDSSCLRGAFSRTYVLSTSTIGQ